MDKSCSSVRGEQGAPAIPRCGGGLVPPVGDQCGHLRLPGDGPITHQPLRGWQECAKAPPTLGHLPPPPSGREHTSHPACASWRRGRLSCRFRPGVRMQTAVLRAVLGGGNTPLQGQRSRVHSPHQGPPHLPGHAHAVQTGSLVGRLARQPGVRKALAQAVYEQRGRLPGIGVVGCALQTVVALAECPQERWWPLHFVQEPVRQVWHRVRDTLRRHAACHLEAPSTFGGLGDGADGLAVRALRGVSRRGGGGRSPRGGTSHRCGGASGVRRSPSPDRLSLGRAARPRCPCFPGAGGVGVGTQHRPRSVRSCEPALRAVGVAGGRPVTRPCRWPPWSSSSWCSGAGSLGPCGRRRGCVQPPCAQALGVPSLWCGAQDEEHVLWGCPEWEWAWATWCP